MTLVLGYCTRCRKDMLDHPSLVCPWCADSDTETAYANLDPNDPLAALDLAVEGFERAKLGVARARALRARAAQEVSTDPVFRTGGYRRKRIGRYRLDTVWLWAKETPVFHHATHCAKGHAFADFGRINTNGRRECERCVKERWAKTQATRAAWMKSSAETRLQRRAARLARRYVLTMAAARARQQNRLLIPLEPPHVRRQRLRELGPGQPL